ncbi:hypothetical protein KIN20_035099 [Parelaphostrongylus tenuis]|uniref:Uncharacterized protein n=1 Tax=Parelaphostrongylus tenuis TaxID=148309 RepID=A0AAD5RAP3_PARTN|nr:hypothetical protein KIN20_035099 [Parelaphostrongylus tenuis]
MKLRIFRAPRFLHEQSVTRTPITVSTPIGIQLTYPAENNDTHTTPSTSTKSMNMTIGVEDKVKRLLFQGLASRNGESIMGINGTG